MLKKSPVILKKYCKFALKLIGIYILVFAVWILISPYYVVMLGKISFWMIPAFISSNAMVSAVSYQDDETLLYRVRLRDEQAGKIIKRNLSFTTKEFAVGLLIVNVLLWSTPRLTIRRRLILALICVLILAVSYSFFCLYLLRVTAFQVKYDFMTLGVVEKLIDLNTLVGWAEEGGFSLFITQLFPATVWFCVVVPTFRSRIADTQYSLSN